MGGIKFLPDAREFQIFIKPVGARCNIHCSYCYYIERSKLYPHEVSSVMSGNVLEKYIIQNIEASGDGVINFSWHGGEPLLAGLSFFRKAIELQRKHLPSGRKIINGIQTNCTLINEDWCRFLADNNFIVGVSMDGPAEFHNRNRTTKNGKPTFDKVLRGYKLLRKYNIPTEILCVVNAFNVNHPLVIYEFFKQLGTKNITFLPLVVRNPKSDNELYIDSVPSPDFGIFLKTIFDKWVEKDIGRIKIQLFEEMIRPAFNLEHTLCIFRENCGGVPVLEHNGDFYSCDHYVDTEHLVGNIMHGTVAEFLDSENQRVFGNVKSDTLPMYCRNCEVKPMCNGECPKNRFIKAPDGEEGLNYLCEGYKYFFNHALPFVKAVGEMWRNQDLTSVSP